jgi:hypothetical protein
VRLQMTAPWLIVGWRAYYVNNTGESATVRISKVTEPQKEDLTSCRADIGNE